MAPPVSPTRSLGSRSREQWNEISSASVESFRFPESNRPQPMLISPIADNYTMDTTRISARQVGSGSRSQWTAFEKPKAITRQASKELDLALGDVPAVSSSSSDVDDNMSTYMESEATYDHSEATAATAVTGHVSTSSTKAHVTPENSSTEGRSRSESRDRGRRQRQGQDESPEPRRLVMCGVNDELKGSIQDVNDTMRQIFSTVRKFGPNEKDAVRETFKDAQYFMKEKVRSALVRKNNNRRSPDRERMDESPPRRRNRETNERRNSKREGRRRERVPAKEKARADESSEVVYDRREPEPVTVTRMLV